jgi:hypothetical protein
MSLESTSSLLKKVSARLVAVLLRNMAKLKEQKAMKFKPPRYRFQPLIYSCA